MRELDRVAALPQPKPKPAGDGLVAAEETKVPPEGIAFPDGLSSG